MNNLITLPTSTRVPIHDLVYEIVSQGYIADMFECVHAMLEDDADNTYTVLSDKKREKFMKQLYKMRNVAF